MEILTDIATKIGFDWRLALTHFINLLLIFVLLVKFALPSIKKTISERTAKIQEGLRMRNEADKIVELANLEGKEINKAANQKASELITKTEMNAKNILTESSQKASEIMQAANLQKDLSKAAGLKDAENILSKDISKILTQISLKSFNSKINGDNNSEFVSTVFSEKYGK